MLFIPFSMSYLLLLLLLLPLSYGAMYSGLHLRGNVGLASPNTSFILILQAEVAFPPCHGRINISVQLFFLSQRRSGLFCLTPLFSAPLLSLLLFPPTHYSPLFFPLLPSSLLSSPPSPLLPSPLLSSPPLPSSLLSYPLLTSPTYFPSSSFPLRVFRYISTLIWNYHVVSLAVGRFDLLMLMPVVCIQ